MALFRFGLSDALRLAIMGQDLGKAVTFGIECLETSETADDAFFVCRLMIEGDEALKGGDDDEDD